MKRRSGSFENFVLDGACPDMRNSDEYFVPLVDQSRDSYGSHNEYIDTSTGPLRNGSGRSCPSPPLHRMETPANPQSPSDEHESQQHRHSHEFNQTHQKQQYRNSNEFPTSSSNPNNVLPLRRSLVFTAHRRKSTFSFAVTAFCILGLCLYSNARSSLRATVQEVDKLVKLSEKLHRQLRRADHDMRLLERELTALDVIEAKREDEEVEERVLRETSAFANPELIQEMMKIQDRLRESHTQADKLKSEVSVISKQDAIAKYGSGVIRIKMDLVFPSTASDRVVVVDTGPHSIILEMASLEIMPHSVYTFLEMVSAGLIDGCSFILNALHVLKAAPLPYDGSSASVKFREFADHGLESVAFREYSPDFPHTKYTIGFAADGSPSFYINTEDNTEIHVGDPCFATIVSGFDTVQRLEEVPTRNGMWFENRVGIRKVTIL